MVAGIVCTIATNMGGLAPSGGRIGYVVPRARWRDEVRGELCSGHS